MIHKNNASGFTLVELVMVIVLLAIVSAVALPRFFGRSDFNEHVLFNDTLNAIRYSQKLAVASGCQIRININSNSYAVLREDSCDDNPPSFDNELATHHPVTGEDGFTGSQAGVALNATNNTTTFNALGQAVKDNGEIDDNNTINVGDRQITIVAETGFSFDSTP